MTTERFTGANVDLSRLGYAIEQYFRTHGFQERKFESGPQGEWFEIQATKAGHVRTGLGARRALHVMIYGEPEDFTVEIKTGEWGKNLVPVAAVAILTAGIGLLPAGIAAGASALTYKSTIDDLWKFVKDQAIRMRNTAKSSREETQKRIEDVRKGPPQPILTKEREIIREVVKIRCSYCKTLYEEHLSSCPNCGGQR